MITTWRWLCAVICLDKDAGNRLANIAAAFPGDKGAERGTFTDDRMLSPAAWYALIPAQEGFAGVVDAINRDAGYDDPAIAYLRDREVTDQEWALAKQILLTAVAEVIQPDGTPTPAPDLLANLLQQHGYTIVEPTDDRV